MADTEEKDPRLEEAAKDETAVIDRAGNRFFVPNDQLDSALADPVRAFHVETDEEAKARQDEAKFGDRPIAAGAAGAARGVSLGLSDLALTKTGLVAPETLKGLEEHNKAASLVGEGIGTAAGLLTGAGELSPLGLVTKAGELGEHAAAHLVGEGIGGRIAARAVGGAIEGGFFGLGSTLSESALGDEQVTAQKLLAGAGMGALLGGVASAGISAGKEGLSELTNKGIHAAAPPSVVERVTAEAGEGAPAAEEVAAATPEAAAEAEMPRNSFADLLEKHKDAVEEAKGILNREYEAGKKQFASTFDDPRAWLADQAEGRTLKATGFIQSDLNKISKEQQSRIARRMLDNGDVAPLSRVEDILENSKGGLSKAKEGIAGAMKAADATGEQFDLQSVVDRARKDVLAPMLKDKALATDADALSKLLDGYEEQAKAGGVTFQDANSFKSTLQKQVKDFQNTAFSKIAKKRLQGIFADELESQVGEVLSGEAKNSYIAAKEAFADYSEAVRAGTKAVNRKLGNRFFGMTDSLAGIGGAVAGGPLGLVTGALGAVANKFARERGSAFAATTLDAFAKSPAFEPMAAAFKDFVDKAVASGEGVFGRYGETLREAAAASPEELLMTHAVLSQKDEAYRKTMEAAGLDYAEPPQTAPRKAALLAALKTRMDEQDLRIGRAVDAFLKQKAIGTGVGEPAAPSPLDVKAKDRADKFAAQARILEQLATNPDALVDHLGAALGGLQEDAPSLAGTLSATASNGIGFLYQKMPKPSDPNQSIPALASPWQPSDAQLAKFDRYVAAVTDPNSVFDGLAHGTVTREAVEALQAVYPQFYDEMKAQVMQQVAAHPKQLSYGQKMALGGLLGSPLVQSAQPQRVAMFQSGPQAKSASQAKPTGNGKPVNVAGGHLSASDRIEGRGAEG